MNHARVHYCNESVLINEGLCFLPEETMGEGALVGFELTLYQLQASCSVQCATLNAVTYATKIQQSNLYQHKLEHYLIPT